MLLGARRRWMEVVARRFTPPVGLDVSAWYYLFDEGPAGAAVHVGADLRDNSYVSGTLDWYSTEEKETADRDLVLAEPISYWPPDASEEPTISGFSRLVLSARDITRLHVSYVATESGAPGTGSGSSSPA